MLIGSIVTGVALVGLLVSILAKHRLGSAITKPVASAGFLAVAIMAGAFQSAFGIALFVALVLSWFGDVFLLSSERKFFLLGLASFLLAHLAFGVAFMMRGVDGLWAVPSLIGFGLVALLIVRWLRPHVDDKMWKPVIAYIVVIVFMVTTAFATYPKDRLYLVQGAAVMFFVSDIFVARHRFVSPDASNRLMGLPLYYGAQLIFAYTISLL